MSSRPDMVSDQLSMDQGSQGHEIQMKFNKVFITEIASNIFLVTLLAELISPHTCINSFFRQQETSQGATATLRESDRNG